MSKAWRNGSSRAYRKQRAYILANNEANNGGRCTVQIPGKCVGKADCVHHTKGRTHGHDPRFMVPSCTPCNLHVGDPTKGQDPAPRPATRW